MGARAERMGKQEGSVAGEWATMRCVAARGGRRRMKSQGVDKREAVEKGYIP